MRFGPLKISTLHCSYHSLAPASKSVVAVMASQAHAVNGLRVTSITRLALRHCQIDEFDLENLLAATPKLRYTECHAWVDYGWYHSPQDAKNGRRVSGLEALFEALNQAYDALEQLVTSQRYVEDSAHRDWGPNMVVEPLFRQREELSKLKRLQTLTVPYASLLEWQRKKDQRWDWDQLLPPSLSHIIWKDHTFIDWACSGAKNEDGIS